MAAQPELSGHTQTNRIPFGKEFEGQVVVVLLHLCRLGIKVTSNGLKLTSRKAMVMVPEKGELSRQTQSPIKLQVKFK